MFGKRVSSGRYKKVTYERFYKGKGNYRSQININKKSVAFGYNCLGMYLGPEVKIIRNKLKDKVEEELDYQIRVFLKTDPKFREFINQYIEGMTDDRMRPEAITFWKERDW